jgi:5-methylcytosine-specific restriction endonuclease McrA
MTTNNRKVVCCGCQNQFLTSSTTVYRKKRCCGNEMCYKVIDQKVTNANYKKQQKKIAKGTFRHGVPIEIKKEIILRDKNTCKLCYETCADNKAQVHHIIPVSNGGLDERKNLVLLCSDCHTLVHQSGWEKYQAHLNNYTKYTERTN